jgi:hypothetical protein
MVELLVHLEAEGGHVEAEPGCLLADLASVLHGEPVECSARDARYCATAIAVRQLEALGMVRVGRRDYAHAERGNRVSMVELVL